MRWLRNLIFLWVFLGCFEGKKYGIEVEEKAFLELRKLAKSAAFRSTDAR